AELRCLPPSNFTRWFRKPSFAYHLCLIRLPYRDRTGRLHDHHLLRASLYRKQLAQRFDAWHRFTELTQNPSAV
ncbi:hypothetical protein PQQ78_15605, partial [Paraburkholderia sediminicola]